MLSVAWLPSSARVSAWLVEHFEELALLHGVCVLFVEILRKLELIIILVVLLVSIFSSTGPLD